MPTFKIPVEWMVTAEVEVNTDTLKEAIEEVYYSPGLLPEGEYLGDSLRIKDMNGEEIFEDSDLDSFENELRSEDKIET